MAAYVDHQFDRGFILDEARARKLHELISTRLAQLPCHPSLKYKVYRGDSYSYVTQSLDDVVGEQNEDWRRLKRIMLFTDKKDEFEMRLILSEKGIDLLITGDDRDAVFLLFSDLREYIQNDVTVVFSISTYACRIIGGALSMAIIFACMAMTLSSLRGDPSEVAEVLASTDSSKKLNYESPSKPLEDGE